MSERTLNNWSDDELLSFIRSGGKGPSAAEELLPSAKTGAVNAVTGILGAPGDIQSAAQAGANYLAPQVAQMPEGARLPTSGDLRKQAEKVVGPLYQPQTFPGKMTRSLLEFSPSALMPGGPVQRAISVVAPALGAEAGDALTKGDPMGRAAGAMAGGLMGIRGITPAPSTPERAALAATLDREGVPMTAGQRTGNKPLQWMEAAASDTPLAASRAANLNEATGRGFTGAVMRRMGASGNEIATPGAVDRAVSDISQRFENLSARNTLQADQAMAGDLVNVIQQYRSMVPESRQAPAVNQIIGDVMDLSARNNHQIPGSVYQSYRSRLEKMSRSARQADPQLSEALGGIRQALDDAMGRSISPADQAAWQEARTQWRNWKAIEKATSGAGSATAEGFISPSQLRGAVAAQNRGQYARGQGDMADLARAGEAILRPLPNSGTAPRAAAGNLFASMAGGLAGAHVGGGAEGMIAGMAAPAIAGRAILSRPVQAYLGNQAMPTTPAELRRLLVLDAMLAPAGSRAQERK